MHFLRYASLLAAAAMLASDVSAAKASTVCVTAKGGKRGTRTHQLPAKTVTVYDVIHPTERVTRVVKPAPKTSTTVVPKIVTVTRTAKADTDVVIVTSTSFSIVVPKKTVEAPTVTPAAITATFIAANTATVTTTVTSYNAEPPLPTLAPSLGRRDGEDDDDDGESGDDVPGVLHARDSAALNASASSCATVKSSSNLKKHQTGKDVYCHAVVKKHVETKGDAVTITATRNINPDVRIVTSALTFTSTKTVFPAEVTSTLTVHKKATLTAPTQTITVTPTVAPSTVTKTVLAPQPTERVVTSIISTCDPSRRIKLKAFSALYLDNINIGVGVLKDAASCCAAIGNIPGSVAWAYDETGANFVQGECFGALLPSADLCTADFTGTTLKAVAGTDEVGGLLGCGASVQWTEA